jgi:hypothetical protein
VGGVPLNISNNPIYKLPLSFFIHRGSKHMIPGR